MGTGGSFLGVKRPGREADHSPSSSAEVKECAELNLHSYNTPSWRGAQLKKSTGTTLPLPFTKVKNVIISGIQGTEYHETQVLFQHFRNTSTSVYFT
jgi:hypothetical protein